MRVEEKAGKLGGEVNSEGGNKKDARRRGGTKDRSLGSEQA
jgi:hypothetical protein